MTTDVAERILAFRRPRDLAPAPDGTRLACSVGLIARPGSGRRTSQIWCGPLEGPLEALTDEDGEDALPRWSPDGATLAFASDRGSPGVRSGAFAVDPAGGQPREIERVHGTIEDLVWDSPTSLLALVGDPLADSLSMEGAVRPVIEEDPRVLRPTPTPRRLIRLDTGTGTATEVGPEGWTLWEIALGADGTVAALGSEEASENGWYRSAILRLDLGRRSAEVLYRATWQIACPAVAPDGGAVAFVEGWASDRGLVIGEVRVVDVATGEVRDLVLPDADISYVRWRDASTIWFAGVAGLRSTYGWLDASGDAHRVWTEEATMRDRFQSEIAPCGDRIAAVLDRLDAPFEVASRALDENAAWQPATALNAEWSQAPPEWDMRRVSWMARDGLEIEGLLVRRREDIGGGPRALALNPRGGPCWPYRFGTIYLQDAVALEAGYAVLLPNPRGTPGRGQAFARANIPEPGIEEIEDALAGVDALAAEGVVDPERVGVMGGSWAGYLTAWALTTRSPRFRCAVMMYGLSNLVSWHRTSNTPRFLEFILQARPDDEEGVAKYMRLSPVTYAHRSRTPTLILSGEEDQCCPVGQQLELYQALAETGTEVELVLYPREGHASANWEHAHQLDYARRALDWLRRHLGEPAPA